MNCAELRRVLPDIMEGHRTAEQEAHLQSCSTCSELVSDLKTISREARLLQESDEPSPRVWNSIEIALRQEGLIRQPQPVLVAGSSRHWSPVWLLPMAATFLVVFGVFHYERTTVTPPPSVATVSAPAPTAVKMQPVVEHGFAARTPHLSEKDDQQMLEVVGSFSPAMRASFQADLQNANNYIRDAEQSAQANPNDEAAQQYLMNAYEQKSMVYEIALDRSLP